MILINIYTGLGSETCEFKYDPTSTILKWKAFKYTDRTGIEGTFEKVNVLQNNNVKSLEDFVESLKFRIDTASINSNNLERDEKIKTYFFGSMKESKEISGEFKNLKLKDGLGKAELYIKMNNKESYIPIVFTFKNNSEIEMIGNIDVFQWNLRKPLENLNKECENFHKGRDGKNKLWNDVELYLSTILIKKCK